MHGIDGSNGVTVAPRNNVAWTLITGCIALFVIARALLHFGRGAKGVASYRP